MPASLIYRIHRLLASVLFAIVFVAQILGFFNSYTALFAIPATGLMLFVIDRLLGQGDSAWQQPFQRRTSPNKHLSHVLIALSVLLITVIFVQRMVIFPYSSLGEVVSDDFAGYHSIKALDLYRTGSAWNLAIPFGQYPFGYESLMSFGLLLTGSIWIVGFFHGLVFVILWLTIILLIMRYSAATTSIEVTMLLALFICLLPIVYPYILDVGKNDTLLALTILLAILYAPVGTNAFHPIGLALATMLSLATKATGIYVLFYLWILVLWHWYQAYRAGIAQKYLSLHLFSACLAIMFVGGLWVIRNYKMMQQVLTSEITAFFRTSIAANLTNPALYHADGEAYALATALLLLIGLSVAALFKARLGWTMSGLLIIIGMTFAFTPLSAFSIVSNLAYTALQWRYVLHGMILCSIVAIVLLMPSITYTYRLMVKRSALAVGLLCGVLALALIGRLGLNDIFSYDNYRYERLLDPSQSEDSVYDAIATLPDGVLYLEHLNWLAATLQQPNLHITQLRYPLGNADISPQPSLDYIATAYTEPRLDLYQAEAWQLIYEDDSGRIYQRK